MVRKNEFGNLVAVQLDNALLLVNDITRTGDLRHHISAQRQLAQVDLAVLVRGVFFRAKRAVYGLDLKLGVGDTSGGIAGIHLDQLHAWLPVVVEGELFDSIPGVKLHLLGRTVDDVFIIHKNFLDKICSGLQIGEQNLAQLACLIHAEALTIPPDLECHAGEHLLIAAVILDDPQAGQLLIDKGDGSGLTGNHRNGFYILRVKLPTLDASDLARLIRSGLQPGKLNGA